MRTQALSLFAGTAILTLATFFPTYVMSQEICRATYQNAIRNISYETATNQELDWTFDKYCDREGTARNFTDNTGAGFTFDNLKFNFTSNKGATEERKKEFCRAYAHDRYNFSRYTSYKNDVQVAALQSLNECVNFATRGIEFAASQVGISSGTIAATFKNRTTNLYVNAVVYDPNLLSCRVSAEGLTRSPNLERREAFELNKNFAITCDRKGIKVGQNITYPPVSVRLETNEGGYSASFDGDALNDFFTANQAKELNDRLQTEVAKQTERFTTEQGRFATLQDRISNAKVRVFRFYNANKGDDGGLPGYRWSCVSDAEKDSRSQAACGGSRYFRIRNPDQSFAYAGCGIDYYIVACLDLDSNVP
ncbi:hypothetical protein AS026_19445 [Rhizobium altiplani]|uniref:Uncharacterized protein n=1 Tax=Rhizobium altiplani TaxID=1864509 RepID=A0A125Q571_9HYPH|nr:hypothetical protein [Rhizobium altiplani]KWV43847.1 hypothetical protein AS026_19445 [Rhizobium altiplani]